MADSTDWQNGTFFQKAKYLLDVKKEWCDCSFLVGSCEQKEMFAHKLFLAMSSPVFETMFYGNMPETFRIPVSDINPDDFEMLLQYIYTESVVLDNLDEAVGVHNAAHKYMIPGLMKLCIDRMWDFVSFETACFIYEFAETYEDKELQDQCLKIISADTTEVLEDTSFLNIKPTTLGTILEMDHLSVPSELDLFMALLRWAEKRKGGSTLRSVVSTTLPKIRFLTLEAHDFAERIPNTDPLTKSEHYEILMNIVSPNTTVVPMPPDFSTNRTERRGHALSESNDEYLWIKNMKTTQNNIGSFSTTTVLFEVSRKMQIVGVEIALKPDPHSGRRGFQDAVLFFEIAKDGGKPVSTTFFHEMKTLPSEMKLNNLVYLERNIVYKLKVILYHPSGFAPSTSVSTYAINSLSNSVPYNLGFPNTNNTVQFGQPVKTSFSIGLNSLSFGQTAPLPQNTSLIVEKPHFIFRDQDSIILKIAV